MFVLLVAFSEIVFKIVEAAVDLIINCSIVLLGV